jgi:hypothetical protein
MDESTNANGLQQPRKEDLHHTKVSHTEPATPVYEGSLEKESASAKSNGEDHHDHDDVDDEKTNNGAAAESAAPTVQPTYLEGIKLYSIVISVTLAAFLILLDMSIIVTVCNLFFPSTLERKTGDAKGSAFYRRSRKSRVTSIPFRMSVGTEVPTSLLRKCSPRRQKKSRGFPDGMNQIELHCSHSLAKSTPISRPR